MCGIAGVIAGDQSSLSAQQEALVGRMAMSLAHRGPDDVGTWFSPRSAVGFGFRRLAIIDTTQAGHQPMQSPSGRFTVVFNGEVYNFVELRKELRSLGHTFSGGSDTEVLLAAFEEWGVVPSLTRLLGMFALAVYDADHEEVTLVRDQLGIKPLYYHERPGFLSFASQPRAFREDAAFPTELDHVALSEYLCSLTVPTPLSVYASAKKLLPGHCLTVKVRTLEVSSQPYHTAETSYRNRSVPYLADTELVDRARAVLGDAVRRQLRSDVPLGAFLSGGIDSSLVTALAQENSSQPLRTYSIGFVEAEFDESAYAAKVAAILGTRHTEIELTHAEALEVIPELPGMFDEPFASPSAIPNYLLCRESRREVTVALSGTGGDECFVGYNRYLAASYLLPRLAKLPYPLRSFGARLIASVTGPVTNAATGALNAVLPSALRIRRSSEKLDKVRRLLRRESAEGMYRELLSVPTMNSTIESNRESLFTQADSILADDSIPLGDRAVLADQLGYLVDDQLTKVDTVSMAVGLEVRVPLLDQAVMEFSWSLPYSAKVRRGRGKWILRELLGDYIPEELIARPKQGLSLPIASWLRGPLREWAGDLLFSDSDVGASLYSEEDVQRQWTTFLEGDDDLALSVWAIAMLHQWEWNWRRSAYQSSGDSHIGARS